MTIKLSVLQGDITQLTIDVIVNAAKNSLLGGGGVDGAIHQAAGPKLLAYCQNLGGCPTGEARLTPGFNLAARYIIHTVGPVWRGGKSHEPELLASCYKQSLLLAEKYQLRRIAFPCISTGIYGFPADKAADIAIKTVSSFVQNKTVFDEIIFCCFQTSDVALYQIRLRNN